MRDLRGKEPEREGDEDEAAAAGLLKKESKIGAADAPEAGGELEAAGREEPGEADVRELLHLVGEAVRQRGQVMEGAFGPREHRKSYVQQVRACAEEKFRNQAELRSVGLPGLSEGGVPDDRQLRS